MPSSHLLWPLCNKLVYDFTYNFSGTVGGYGICVHIVYGHRGISVSNRPGKAVVRLPVQLPCNLCRFRTEISCRLHTEATQRWCCDCARAEDHCTTFLAQMTI